MKNLNHKNKYFRALPLCSLWLISIAFLFIPLLSLAEEGTKEKSWWEKREGMADLYFPHNKHMKALKKKGDPCMLCHPFSPTDITDIKTLEKVTVIANEPLEAICHSCHLVELTAPSECRLCHKDPAKIWPDKHNYKYKRNHAEDARVDPDWCKKCHMSPSFCTNCHFRRDQSARRVHSMGYRGSHGIEARISPGQCGRCHNSRYCRDCHKGMR